MPFPLLIEQDGIVVGIVDAPGWAGDGVRPAVSPAPDPVVTIELLRALADLIEKNNSPKPEAHGKPCHYCGEPCDPFSGNPGLWPVALCHAEEPGVAKWHHSECVSIRLTPIGPAERVAIANIARAQAIEEAALAIRGLAEKKD